jgi:hypothetical protein
VEAGCDGVIASGHEAAKLKAEFGRRLLVVTPGIRPAGTEAGDQKRTVDVAQAFRNGADYIVVGRPIRAAADPRAAAQAIQDTIARVFQRLEQPPEMLVMGEEGAVEELGAVALTRRVGKFSTSRSPTSAASSSMSSQRKRARGKFLRQLEEALAVAFAAVAPQGAKAGDVQGRVHRCPILFTRSPE